MARTISSLYSIGHGQKTQEEFISELRSFDIHFLVDVRSSPYSKWVPHFNQGIIERWLKQEGVRYVYMGDYIGGRPQNENCYDEEGYFDYRMMAEEPTFKTGVNRLVDANNKKCRVAIMCSESDPSECHRSKLIGRELYFLHNISMNHIIAINKTISQEEIMKTLTKGLWEPDGNLFGACEPPFFKSRKSYKNLTDTSEETYNPYD
ncbi:DUF488 domain-containing protein [Parabacteroides distasonis]|uniref:DUF488 domain-containing protein n=1 Tax=Parabacteroides distasonis TaxID=823 RepID=UPI0028052D77|nr:DUF488 domain-containing protein [Parabacteroides distasonis]WMI41426.1 DUF488 domain-containing protein [Parabacteroides distasonis]